MSPDDPVLGIDHVYYWTRDMDRAVAFYGDVLGLPLIHRSGDEWAEFRAGAVRFAIHGTDEAQVPPGGTVVFRVEDLDAARWSLQQRGVGFDGHEAEVAGFARFTTFHDPDGNPVQLIEYLGPERAP
jgi:catechol 2,3-dioxygenase-like lactoylglutathione lyase family enzyme